MGTSREDKLIDFAVAAVENATGKEVGPKFIHHLLHTDFKCGCWIEAPEFHGEEPQLVLCDTYRPVYEQEEAQRWSKWHQKFRDEHNGMNYDEWRAHKEREALRRNPQYREAEEKGLLP